MIRLPVRSPSTGGLLVALALSASDGVAQGVHAHNTERAPDGVDVRVPVAPSLVRAGATTLLRYELHVTNVDSAAVLVALQVTAGAATRAHPSAPPGFTRVFTGDTLAAMTHAPGAPATADGRVSLAAGQVTVVFLDLSVPAGARVSSLDHRLTIERTVTPDSVTRTTVDAGPVRVGRDTVPVLSPPLRGGPWVAAYDPTLARGHRRVLYALDGRARIPGRYAIDWFAVDSLGRLARAAPGAAGSSDVRPDALADFAGYGAPVLAVADGQIVAVHDGVAEPARASLAGRVSAAQAAGNYIVLDLGGGRYAIYEHLQPGVLVRRGQRVRRGDVIARVGFSGQTRIPHLHFHVADAPSPLAGEGRPFVLTGYRVLGRYASLASFSRGERWSTAASPGAQDVSRALPSAPAANTVVRFEGGAHVSRSPAAPGR